ncbi:hypothetical protein D3C78_1220830 [compost metagenome]
MFDPTVFENLKVAIENQLYDLDNLDREIDIVGRIDRLEMAVMSREFALRFTLPESKSISAEIWLTASLKDLAAEILELAGESPGCTLKLRYYMQISDVQAQCAQIDRIIEQIWGSELVPVQTISYVFGDSTKEYENQIELRFQRKINEEQMDDISGLLEHMQETLRQLVKLQQ